MIKLHHWQRQELKDLQIALNEVVSREARKLLEDIQSMRDEIEGIEGWIRKYQRDRARVHGRRSGTAECKNNAHDMGERYAQGPRSLDTTKEIGVPRDFVDSNMVHL